MNSPFRFVIFMTVVLSVWTLMHAYVLSRILGIPGITAKVPLAAWYAVTAALWAIYPLARVLSKRLPATADFLELAGSIWIGVLFLTIVWLFAADLITGFGFFLTRAALPLRLAAFAVAGILSLFALFQAARPPEVTELEFKVKNLRPEHDGLRLVHLTDLHLGSHLGVRWLTALSKQVAELKPDLLLVTGDVIDEVNRMEAMLPQFRTLTARLGAFGVTGNHEFYSGFQRSTDLLKSGGLRILRNEHIEVAPGLIVAGVDDLTALNQFNVKGDPLEAALAGRPEGATIFLCHTPWRVDDAARLGADVMLSGHTHNGQLWPFNYLVRIRYPFVAGKYSVGKMTLYVSRGTGFWGPPMRLFGRSEIVKIVLRRA